MKYTVRLKSDDRTASVEKEADFVNGTNTEEITFPEFQVKDTITHFSLVDADGNEFTGPLDQALHVGPFYKATFHAGRIKLG